VYTADNDRGLDVARRMRTGMVHINGGGGGIDSPFGGFKQSGMGREMGPEGFMSYLEVKSMGLPRTSPASIAVS
jgi:betaine-aldehyde dehydrogenase